MYERAAWKLTLPHVKLTANRNLLVAQETQTGVLYQPRGWDGEGDGREGQEGGGVCIPMADSC